MRDLAARFKTRIEMRQIGVRDEVKMLGGIGVCGRQTCCSQFLTSFEPITIRMAKEQDLSINQSKLSGICGRLMCCLGYEYRDSDEETGVSAPEGDTATAGDDIQVADTDEITPGGTGEDGPPVSSTESATPAGERKAGTSAQPEQSAGRRRRKRRRKKRNPPPEAAASERPEPAAAAEPGEAGNTEGTPRRDRGRPFSKRRRFWKKKKH